MVVPHPPLTIQKYEEQSHGNTCNRSDAISIHASAGAAADRAAQPESTIALQLGQLGNTVRRGGKWANVPKGHVIDLTEGPDHKYVGAGRVVKVWTGPFNEVPAVVLDRNHSGSQSYSSVLAAMRNAYGAEFTEDEIVVFLDYTRIN